MKLKYFLFGFFVSAVGLHIINSIVSFMEMGIELIRAKFDIDITKCNNIIEEMSSEQDKNHVSVMGFSIANEEELDE